MSRYFLHFRKHMSNQTPKAGYYMAKELQSYRPEDTAYLEKIRKLMNQNEFIFDMDNLNLKKN